MKVCSFLAGIPPGNKNPNKPVMLKGIIEGVNAVGDQGIVVEQKQYVDCDVAVIQGFVHEHGKSAPHLAFRKEVHQRNTVKPKRCIIIDSNMFSYHTGRLGDSGMCRYSFDGVFPTTGEYCSDGVGSEHWERLQKNYGLELKPWTKSGEHILICLQRNGGWSMMGEDVTDWLRNTIATLKQHTQRKIVIRCHPGDGKFRNYIDNIKKIDPNLIISDHTTRHIMDDLTGAWTMIVKNSSPSVAAVMNGIPVFVTDPINCQAGPVANTDISKIETPSYPEREEWLWKICASHWNIQELKNGECWKHMRKYV